MCLCLCVCVMSVCAYVKVCSSSQATFSNPSTAPAHSPFSNADGSSMLQMISAATTAREPFAVDPCHIFVLLPPSLIPSLPLSLPLSVLLILYKFQFEFFGQAIYLIIFIIQVAIGNFNSLLFEFVETNYIAACHMCVICNWRSWWVFGKLQFL